MLKLLEALKNIDHMNEKMSRTVTPVPTAPTYSELPLIESAQSSSCSREWVTFCDHQASVAADHFFKNIYDSLLTTSTSSSLPEDITANHVLQRYVETFSKSIEAHLHEKSIRDEISFIFT